MGIADHGTASGKGNTERAAVEAALRKAKEDLLEHADDSVKEVWDGKYTRLTLTIEKPIDKDDGTSVFAWKVVVAACENLSGGPPAHGGGTFGPGANPEPSLCDHVFVDDGTFRTTVEAPCTRAKAFNDAIDKVEKRIADQKCAVACRNKRARLSVEFAEVGHTEFQDRGHEIDRITYKVKWHLQLYCFDAKDEKV